MEKLLNTLFVKRYCLPKNTNTEKYETGQENVLNCNCQRFNHVACVFREKDFKDKEDW
jgi:hypothetical protein